MLQQVVGKCFWEYIRVFRHQGHDSMKNSAYIKNLIYQSVPVVKGTHHDCVYTIPIYSNSAKSENFPIMTWYEMPSLFDMVYAVNA